MFKENAFYDIRRYVRKIRGFTLEGVVEVSVGPAGYVRSSVQSMHITGTEPKRDILDIIDRSLLADLEHDISEGYEVEEDYEEPENAPKTDLNTP